MNNYNRYYDGENQQNFYQYNLWQNSYYNNGFNLHCGFYDGSLHQSDDSLSQPSDEGEKAEDITDMKPSDEGEKAEDLTDMKPSDEGEKAEDVKNRRIIMKADLYVDPAAFTESDAPECQPYALGYDWTKQNWRKAGEEPAGPSRPPARPRTTFSKIQERVLFAMAQPVHMTKAKSMMQKMGWQGGALGKSGDGIVEPITPDATYALRTVGFGQVTQPTKPGKTAKQARQQRPPKYNKAFFTTNVLLQILEFVKNDFEIEVLFDAKLHNGERKIIHDLVGYLDHNEGAAVLDEIELEIVAEVRQRCQYTLSTLSEGERPLRQLCLFKEAPRHVYLITPYDLQEPFAPKPQPDRNVPDKPDEEETNPFLISITRNLKNEDMKSDEILDKFEGCTLSNKDMMNDLGFKGKILAFFHEFADRADYTEFRFLGPFNGSMIECINAFINELFACVQGHRGSEEYARVFKCVQSDTYGYEIKEDCNECVVIYKFKKDAKKS